MFPFGARVAKWAAQLGFDYTSMQARVGMQDKPKRFRMLWAGQDQPVDGEAEPFANALNASVESLLGDGRDAEGVNRDRLFTLVSDRKEAHLFAAWWNNVRLGMNGASHRNQRPMDDAMLLGFRPNEKRPGRTTSTECDRCGSPRLAGIHCLNCGAIQDVDQ